MNDELVTIQLPKCILRLYASEIQRHLPDDVYKLGLLRGKGHNRFEGVYGHTDDDPADQQAKDLAKLTFRLQKEAALKKPFKPPYKSH